MGNSHPFPVIVNTVWVEPSKSDLLVFREALFVVGMYKVPHKHICIAAEKALAGLGAQNGLCYSFCRFCERGLESNEILAGNG